jgi:TrmH family RNA methyltransferase
VEAVTNAELKPYRKGFAHSYALGTQTVLALLSRRPEAAKLVVASPRGERSGAATAAVATAEGLGVEVRRSDKLLARLTRRDDIYLMAAFAKLADTLDPSAVHLALVAPSDFGNLGTIFRTALGFGVGDVALIGAAADDQHPRTVRASMGARFDIRVERFPDLDAYRIAHPRRIHPFVSAGGTPLPDVAFAHPFTLLFGPEGAGLTAAEVVGGDPVTIPQSPNIDSLNLAVAVGVALYQACGR